jgi:hypothetical protein
MYEYLTVADGKIERYMIDISLMGMEGGKPAGKIKNRLVFDSYKTETEVNTKERKTKKHNGISAGVDSYYMSTYLRRARPSANLLSRAAVKPDEAYEVQA